jgi:hypothetical protein
LFSDYWAKFDEYSNISWKEERKRLGYFISNNEVTKLMKTAFLILVLICLMPPGYGAKQQTPNAVPKIRLDKNRFALGESILFWAGVEQTSEAPIPKEYQKTGRLIITRPDGTQQTEDLGWPSTGPGNRGWLGSAGLGEDKIQLGRYTLVVEFAGQRTAPAFLFVEDVPILSKIKTNFKFDHSGQDAAPLNVRLPTTETVTLIVHNGSDQTVTFPRLGGGSTRLVSVSIRRVDGSYTSESFYPDEKLSGSKSWVGTIDYDVFTWDIAPEVPTIILQPGKTFRQKLSLQAAFDEANENLPLHSGEYKVGFSTELQILVGPKGGPWAELSPMRLSVEAVATCTVTL